VRYDPAHAGGWSAKQFVEAARERGVPVEQERYAAIGPEGHPLHASPIFTTLDVSELGGPLGQTRSHTPDGSLPVTESLAGRLLTLPPFTKVPERAVRECGRTLRAVAEEAARAPARAPAARTVAVA